MPVEKDRWCEQRLFGSVQSGLAEPMAACTGIVMVLLFAMPNAADKSTKLPPLFLWTKASLLLLGMGTVIFHGMSHAYAAEVLHINLDMFDWLPLVLVAASFVSLYGHHHLRGSVIIYAALCTWVLFLVICMDSSTYAFWEDAGGWWGFLLNGILLAPLLGTLLLATYTTLKWQALYLWSLLILSAVLWAVNVAACPYAPALAVLHAVYHIVMAVALVHAACLGLLLFPGWELVPSRFYLPAMKVRLLSTKTAAESAWLLKP